MTSLVSIIGAGKVGSTLAQRIAEKNLADVVLLDVVNGLPQGIALDLAEARGIESHNCQIVGSNDYADTGKARKPGMSRDELIQTNAKIVVEAAKQAVAHAPNAILIIVTNPLDVMTYLAWRATNLPIQRVMGMAGVLDSVRLQAFIAMELGVATAEVSTMVLGSHGDLMVPLPGYCTVSGVPITELMEGTTIERLVQRTRQGGAEIGNLLQTGGAYFAPASSACLMVETILQNRVRLLPAAAYLQGEYGLQDIFLGVPCWLGGQGVEGVLELQISEAESAALRTSAESVRHNLEEVISNLSGD
ncbi:MAG: malate dehydrogenase [Cyanobacteria bacterium SW_6_48_11]|nr:MAG: malate dehydrogenase [Cyanobacteria bacterium SW_6_48_11]